MYTHKLILCIKGWKLLRNYMCHVTHHKSYGLVLTDAIELLNCIAYILVHIIIFLLRWFYDILCVMFASKSWTFSITWISTEVSTQSNTRPSAYWEFSTPWKLSLSCQSFNTQVYIFLINNK